MCVCVCVCVYFIKWRVSLSNTGENKSTFYLLIYINALLSSKIKKKLKEKNVANNLSQAHDVYFSSPFKRKIINWSWGGQMIQINKRLLQTYNSQSAQFVLLWIWSSSFEIWKTSITPLVQMIWSSVNKLANLGSPWLWVSRSTRRKTQLESSIASRLIK